MHRKIPLPRGWNRRTKAAILRILALSHQTTCRSSRFDAPRSHPFFCAAVGPMRVHDANIASDRLNILRRMRPSRFSRVMKRPIRSRIQSFSGGQESLVQYSSDAIRRALDHGSEARSASFFSI